LSVFDDALEGALERLDGFGHLAKRNLENLEHRNVIIRCERGAHELVQIRRVMCAILCILHGLKRFAYVLGV
jgi:hypothetical protein